MDFSNMTTHQIRDYIKHQAHHAHKTAVAMMAAYEAVAEREGINPKRAPKVLDGICQILRGADEAAYYSR